MKPLPPFKTHLFVKELKSLLKLNLFFDMRAAVFHVLFNSGVCSSVLSSVGLSFCLCWDGRQRQARGKICLATVFSVFVFVF